MTHVDLGPPEPKETRPVVSNLLARAKAFAEREKFIEKTQPHVDALKAMDGVMGKRDAD